ncbi:MAG: hypothetical protein ABWY16_10390 [Pedobacter sp.]|uniref:hypothetical protein n=1 Tax=Pedobacter sp. TaxID=1411316 RepID=UPI0033993D95
MFNNVVLDVAIGVVFIFLLYSLLATSIQEAIASGLALRARTLKDGIINGMLCNTPNYSRIESLAVGTIDFFKSFIHLFHKPAVTKKRLGHYFYDHPMIKNYGSSRIYSLPSYLPGGNFSTVIIDILRDDFFRKLDAIAETKLADTPGQTKEQIAEQLRNSADGVKIKELLSLYASYYLTKTPLIKEPDLIIERDTLQILQMHLRNSYYNLDDFVKKIETWYDDSMDRISGWYKRRVQLLLFLIGLFIAIAFNVDIIRIAGKLSSDKDARDQLVQIAIKEADNYKDDPRVNTLNPSRDSDLVLARERYDRAIKDARKIIDTSIVKPNQILALGWGDYGRSNDSIKLFKKLFEPDSVKIVTAYTTLEKKLRKALPIVIKAAPAKKSNIQGIIQNQVMAKVNGKSLKDSLRIAKVHAQSIAYQCATEDYSGLRRIKNTTAHVLRESWDAAKIAGFLLTALAICLGAPFWFDLLNKLVNIRATGKREENNNSSGVSAGTSPEQQPVTVNIGNQQAGGEAVG